MNSSFWRGKRALVTGHTGFKGLWLTQWLKRAGAVVTGFALAPPPTPSLFERTRVGDDIRSIENDIRDLGALTRAVADAKTEIVLHMAAQSLVRASYDEALGTYATNVMGAVHLPNTVSPGFTRALPFAEHLVEKTTA